MGFAQNLNTPTRLSPQTQLFLKSLKTVFESLERDYYKDLSPSAIQRLFEVIRTALNQEIIMMDEHTHILSEKEASKMRIIMKETLSGIGILSRISPQDNQKIKEALAELRRESSRVLHALKKEEKSGREIAKEYVEKIEKLQKRRRSLANMTLKLWKYSKADPRKKRVLGKTGIFFPSMANR